VALPTQASAKNLHLSLQIKTATAFLAIAAELERAKGLEPSTSSLGSG